MTGEEYDEMPDSSSSGGDSGQTSGEGGDGSEDRLPGQTGGIGSL